MIGCRTLKQDMGVRPVTQHGAVQILQEIREYRKFTSGEGDPRHPFPSPLVRLTSRGAGDQKREFVIISGLQPTHQRILIQFFSGLPGLHQPVQKFLLLLLCNLLIQLEHIIRLRILQQGCDIRIDHGFIQLEDLLQLRNSPTVLTHIQQ